jgi:hypothetical protein
MNKGWEEPSRRGLLGGHTHAYMPFMPFFREFHLLLALREALFLFFGMLVVTMGATDSPDIKG